MSCCSISTTDNLIRIGVCSSTNPDSDFGASVFRTPTSNFEVNTLVIEEKERFVCLDLGANKFKECFQPIDLTVI